MVVKRKHGYDGHAPHFMPARDIESVDRLTGVRRRETPAGPLNVNTDRIEWLLARDKLSKRQYAAARRFQADWERAQILPVAAPALVRSSGRSAPELPNDAKVAAMRRHRAAAIALGRWHRVVELVALENRTLAQAAAALHMHAERASEQLETGLDVLADHYGLGT